MPIDPFDEAMNLLRPVYEQPSAADEIRDDAHWAQTHVVPTQAPRPLWERDVYVGAFGRPGFSLYERHERVVAESGAMGRQRRDQPGHGPVVAPPRRSVTPKRPWGDLPRLTPERAYQEVFDLAEQVLARSARARPLVLPLHGRTASPDGFDAPAQPRARVDEVTHAQWRYDGSAYLDEHAAAVVAGRSVWIDPGATQTFFGRA
jgi:hypothetical protein